MLFLCYHRKGSRGSSYQQNILRECLLVTADLPAVPWPSNAGSGASLSRNWQRQLAFIIQARGRV